jgi:uncharacterized HAD superfamily protein
MKRQIIAVDIDDVIHNTAQNLIDYANDTYGTRVVIDDYHTSDYEKTWNSPDRETTLSRANAYFTTNEYLRQPPSTDVVAILTKLSTQHELHIITGRSSFTEASTRKWLNTFLPDIFQSITLSDHLSLTSAKPSKGTICRELGANILIDDHLDHILSAVECGIIPLLSGNYPWNRKVENLPKSVVRVRDWNAVARYFHVSTG